MVEVPVYLLTRNTSAVNRQTCVHPAGVELQYSLQNAILAPPVGGIISNSLDSHSLCFGVSRISNLRSGVAYI